jgi:hypothetical protein
LPPLGGLEARLAPLKARLGWLARLEARLSCLGRLEARLGLLGWLSLLGRLEAWLGLLGRLSLLGRLEAWLGLLGWLSLLGRLEAWLGWLGRLEARLHGRHRRGRRHSAGPLRGGLLRGLLYLRSRLGLARIRLLRFRLRWTAGVGGGLRRTHRLSRFGAHC